MEILTMRASFIWTMFALLFAASSGCQTTSLAARKSPNPGAELGGAPKASCLRLHDRRQDCEDTVGCFWDYDSGSCQSH